VSYVLFAQSYLYTCFPTYLLEMCRLLGHGDSHASLKNVDVQMLREAAAKGSQMMHAPGTTPPPASAPLGAAGAETIKEFEVTPGPNSNTLTLMPIK
jgi:hypothetical protein